MQVRSLPPPHKMPVIFIVCLMRTYYAHYIRYFHIFLLRNAKNIAAIAIDNIAAVNTGADMVSSNYFQ